MTSATAPDLEISSAETDSDLTGSAETATRGSWRRPGPFALLVVLIVVLAVVAGTLGFRLRSIAATERDRADAAAAAKQLAVSLTTISAASSTANIQQLLASTTGSLKDQIAQSSSTLSQVLTTNDVTSTGFSVETGVTSLSDRTATVLIAVDASVSSGKEKAAQRHYRMQATLTKIGDRWLVSNMEFVP